MGKKDGQGDDVAITLDAMKKSLADEKAPLALVNRKRNKSIEDAPSPIVKKQKLGKPKNSNAANRAEEETETIENLKSKLELREQQIDLLEKQLMKEKEIVKQLRQGVDEALPLLRLAESSLEHSHNVDSM